MSVDCDIALHALRFRYINSSSVYSAIESLYKLNEDGYFNTLEIIMQNEPDGACWKLLADWVCDNDSITHLMIHAFNAGWATARGRMMDAMFEKMSQRGCKVDTCSLSDASFVYDTTYMVAFCHAQVKHLHIKSAYLDPAEKVLVQPRILKFFDGFSNLVTWTVARNKLKEIPWSKYIQQNKATLRRCEVSYDVTEDLLDAVIQCPNLSTLVLIHCKDDTFDKIKHLQHVKEFHVKLNSNQHSLEERNLGIKICAQCIETFPVLETVYLEIVDYTSTAPKHAYDITSVFVSMVNNRTVKRLHFDIGKRFNSSSYKSVCEMLVKNTFLEHLNMSFGPKNEDNSCEEFLLSMARNTSITHYEYIDETPIALNIPKIIEAFRFNTVAEDIDDFGDTPPFFTKIKKRNKLVKPSYFDMLAKHVLSHGFYGFFRKRSR